MECNLPAKLYVEEIEVFPVDYREYALRVSALPRNFGQGISVKLLELSAFELGINSRSRIESVIDLDSAVGADSLTSTSLLFELSGVRDNLEYRIGWLIFPLSFWTRSVFRLPFNNISNGIKDPITDLILKGSLPVRRSKSSVTFSSNMERTVSGPNLNDSELLPPSERRAGYIQKQRQCKLPVLEADAINAPLRTSSCQHIKFSPCAPLLALHTGHSLFVYDIRLRKRSAMMQDVIAFAWFESEAHIAVGCSDGSLRVWDLESGDTQELASQGSDITTNLCVVQRGKGIFGTTPTGLKLWSERERRTIPIPNEAKHICVLPDNEICIVSSGQVLKFGENESLIYIDLPQNFVAGYHAHLLLEGGEIYEISASKIISTIAPKAISICISPDRQYISAGDSDGRVRFFDYQSGDLLYLLPTKLPCAVACIDWSPFDDMLAFTGNDGEEGASLPILLYAPPECPGESFRDWSTRWTSHVPETEGMNVKEMKERILNSIISSQKYRMTSSDE